MLNKNMIFMTYTALHFCVLNLNGMDPSNVTDHSVAEQIVEYVKLNVERDKNSIAMLKALEFSEPMECQDLRMLATKIRYNARHSRILGNLEFLIIPLQNLVLTALPLSIQIKIDTAIMLEQEKIPNIVHCAERPWKVSDNYIFPLDELKEWRDASIMVLENNILSTSTIEQKICHSLLGSGQEELIEETPAHDEQ